MSATESNADRPASDPNDRRRGDTELAHATVENAAGETELTIYPRECDDAAVATTWITAAGDSFVALDVVR